jgi:hypothetical protein
MTLGLVLGVESDEGNSKDEGTADPSTAPLRGFAQDDA